MNTHPLFTADELVVRKQKVDGEWQERIFPVVGGRLRLAHEGNKQLGITTELISWDGKYAVAKCDVTTEKGPFSSYGSANAQRDARLQQSLIELACTRAVARALRLAGYGVDLTSAEEVDDEPPKPTKKKTPAKTPSETQGIQERLDKFLKQLVLLRADGKTPDDVRDQAEGLICEKFNLEDTSELRDEQTEDLQMFVKQELGGILRKSGFLKEI